MRITVKSIGTVENVNKGRNNWQEIAIEYVGNKGPASRKIKSFEKDVFNAFKQTIKPGDTVEVKVVKEGDFWNWKDAAVVEGDAGVANHQAEKSTSSGSISKKVGDWETSAERAARQRYIVRQSSISSAIEYFSHRPDLKAGISEILNVAETFERHVFGEDNPKTDAAISSGPNATRGRGRPAKQAESEEGEVE